MKILQAKNYQLISRYGTLFAFIALIIVITILTPQFLRVANIINILRQTSVNGIIAVGMTFVIITGGIDLSVGSLLALASVVACSFAHPGDFPLLLPLGIGVLVGLLGGLINGFIISRKTIAPFIVTLGMMTIARGFALVYTDGRPVINLSNNFNNIGGGYIIGIPIPIIIFGVIALLGGCILKYTRLGRYTYAIGGNEEAARISGINTKSIIMVVYALTGLLAGLAGIVLSSRVMSGSPAIGFGYELDAIAAVVIGGTSLSGGVGSIRGTVLGVLIIGVMNNGLDLLNVSSYWQQIAKGTIIIIAVLLDLKKK
jgi:ribose/xylose/arabinose/galactoside ABC-type transport system permease subunit